MAEERMETLRATAPLGLDDGAVALREITDRALVTIALPDDAVRARLERAFGVALPAVGHSAVATGGERLLGLQSDRLYVLFAQEDTKADPERVLRERIGADEDRPVRATDVDATGNDAGSDMPGDAARNGTASLLYSSDQSDGWCMLHLDGPASRGVLERVCPLDLHPDVYPIGRVARSVVEHLGAIVLREGENAFVLLSARSSARDFLHEIETSVHHLHAVP